MSWSSTERLPLNSNKCCVLSISLKKKPLNFEYALDDLGIIIDSRLTIVSHVDSIIKKATCNRTCMCGLTLTLLLLVHVPFSFQLMHHLKPFATMVLNGEITVQSSSPAWYFSRGSLYTRVYFAGIPGMYSEAPAGSFEITCGRCCTCTCNSRSVNDAKIVKISFVVHKIKF